MRLTLSTKYLFGLALLLCIGTPAAAQSPSPDFTHLKITMEARGVGCARNVDGYDGPGPCPAYSVSLDENGTVTYKGVAQVKERGERVHSIPIAAVRDLVAEFLRIDFYSLEDRYIEKKLPDGRKVTVDHAYATTITIDLDGKQKSVYMFYGTPDELIKLQRKLYEVTRIAQYTGWKCGRVLGWTCSTPRKMPNGYGQPRQSTFSG